MYKCSECGAEYKHKPEYCECGNDEFLGGEPTKKGKPVPNGVSKNLLSIVFLVVCIILSVFILLIKVEDKKAVKVVEEKTAKSRPVNWALFEPNETKPKKSEPTVSVAKTVTAVTPVTTKKTTQQTKPKTVAKSVKPATQKPKPTATESKKTTATTSVVQATSKVDAQKELDNYKLSVARKFYYQMDFMNVIGNGKCEVTFKIDNSGKVIEKNFATPSQNTTLNDVVYNAVRNISFVSAPPASYKGQTLTLQVKFYNKSYSVTVN